MRVNTFLPSRRCQPHQRRSTPRLWMGALALVFVLLAQAVQAEDLVWATGKVTGQDGLPVPGAMVAVYDENNKVVDFARTDKNGEYALAVPKKVLNLNKHSRGFFTEVFGGITRFVGDAAGFVANPLRAGVRAVTSAQAGLIADPLTKGGISAGGAVADQVLFSIAPRQHKATTQEERKQPGAMLIKVANPGSNDLLGVARVYWIQQETFKAGGKQSKTLAAWLDPVQLTPADSSQPSKVESEYLRFTGARIVPSIAQPGQLVRLMVKIPTPPDPPVYMVVVARNNRTGQKWELKPTSSGRYEVEIEVDKKFPRDDQTLSVIAYAAQTQVPGRRHDAEGAIEGAGLWDAKKPYIYNPLLVVSRNRADLTLTVLASEKGKR